MLTIVFKEKKNNKGRRKEHLKSLLSLAMFFPPKAVGNQKTSEARRNLFSFSLRLATVVKSTMELSCSCVLGYYVHLSETWSSE